MLRLLLAGLFCASCGSGDSCQPPSGVYVVTTSAVSGNCGPGGTVTVDVDAPDDADCAGDVRSTDACVASGTVICNHADGSSTRTTLSVDWASDGDSARGTLTVEKTTPPTCIGTYNITYRR